MQAVTVQRLSDGVGLAVGKADGQVTAIRTETADIQLRLNQTGRTALGKIEAYQFVVVTQPDETVVDQHGLDTEISERLNPCFQVLGHVIIIEA